MRRHGTRVGFMSVEAFTELRGTVMGDTYLPTRPSCDYAVGIELSRLVLAVHEHIDGRSGAAMNIELT